jgi:hypothetical protein
MGTAGAVDSRRGEGFEGDAMVARLLDRYRRWMGVTWELESSSTQYKWRGVCYAGASKGCFLEAK